MAFSCTAKQISECFIKPKRTKNETLGAVHLSKFDLFMLPIPYMQGGFLFSKPVTPMATLLEKLKDSLSATLVHFYSLAGQLETRSQVDQENHHTCNLIFINCKKGPGARFLHSTLDVSITDFLLPAHRLKLIHPLFDHNIATGHDGHTLSLLTVHVTELIDGVFMALSLNHVCADAESFLHFLASWSHIFTVEDADIREPVYNPAVLDRKSPPALRLDELVHQVEHPFFKEKTFHFSAQSMARLKADANSDCETTNKISSFQALAALLWRCISRTRSIGNERYTHCGFPFSYRGRLSPPLSPYYFGNAVQLGLASCKASEMEQRSLGWTAMLLNEFLESFNNDNKVMDDIQPWMQLHEGSNQDVCGILFAGSPKFQLHGAVDFGMGKVLDTIHGRGTKHDGELFTSAGLEKGSVDVDACLSVDCMNALESDEELIKAVYFVGPSSL